MKEVIAHNGRIRKKKKKSIPNYSIPLLKLKTLSNTEKLRHSKFSTNYELNMD